jgi:hypothetical protein
VPAWLLAEPPEPGLWPALPLAAAVPSWESEPHAALTKTKLVDNATNETPFARFIPPTIAFG